MMIRTANSRRPLLATLLACAALSGPALGQETATPAQAVVEAFVPKANSLLQREIRLHMTPLDAEVLFRKDPWDLSYFDVSVEAGGQRLAGSIEVKGSSTTIFAKRGLYIKLKDGQWHGLKKISLDATATDSSRLRQWLAWNLFADLGLAVPKVNFTRVFINDRYYGPYLNIEWIDGKLFERHGLGTEGQFFQADDKGYCGDFQAQNALRLATCWNKHAPRDNDFSALAELDRAIRETPVADYHSFIEQKFDSETLINWMVVNLLVMNNDTYNKNYFLYLPAKTGKWVAVPWDYDLTFGRAYDPDLPYPANIYNDNFQYNSTPELGAISPLKEKVLRNPQLRARYMARVKHLLGLARDDKARPETFGWFTPGHLDTRIDAARTDLGDDVAHDPYDHDLTAFGQGTDGLKHFVRVRGAFLHEKLFGAFPWSAETAYWDPGKAPPQAPIPSYLHAPLYLAAGEVERLHVDPGYAYTLLGIQRADASQALDLSVSNEMNQPPRHLPPGMKPEQCVQRSWLLGVSSPQPAGKANLALEYLQEARARQERGKTMDETGLQVWMNRGGEWQALPTRVLPLANVLQVDNFELQAGHHYRFVACSPAP